MRKLFSLLLLLFAIPTISAQDNTDNLFELLNAVPDQPEIRQSLITFIDYENLFEARDGTPMLPSLSALEILPEQVGSVYMAALNGINSGPEFVQMAPVFGDEWVDTVGFDFVDIDRAITFGDPPAVHDILFGEFDVEAIETAFTNREYTSKPIGNMSLWCFDVACEDGNRVSVENRNPTNPFGGNLGREQPILVSDTVIASATADVGLILIEDAIGDRVDSLADNAMFASAVNVIPPENLVIQGMFVPTQYVTYDAATYVFDGDADAIEALLIESDRMAQYQMVMLADTATEDEQVAYVVLVYRDEDSANIATEVVLERLDTMDSMVAESSLQEIFDARGVTDITAEVIVDEDNALSLAVFEFRAPKASNEEDEDTRRLLPSSMLYRVFVQMVYNRDTAWLIARSG